MHIDDTDDWLGIPTPLEVAIQHGALLENEIQEMTIQLRQARENIFKLVEMHALASTERDRLKIDLEKARKELSAANQMIVETRLKSDWELMAMNKHLAELAAEVKRLHGLEDYAPLPPIPPIH